MQLGPLPVARHDDGEDFLYASDLPRRRIRYLNSLFTESRVGGLVL